MISSLLRLVGSCFDGILIMLGYDLEFLFLVVLFLH